LVLLLKQSYVFYHNQAFQFVFQLHKNELYIIVLKNLPESHELNDLHEINQNQELSHLVLEKQKKLLYLLENQNEVEQMHIRRQKVLLLY
jgi:hypothetical protein